MKPKLLKHLTFILMLVSITAFSQSKSQDMLSAIENTNQYKTVELIHMDKDLSIFSNLITLSGLDTSLAFTDSEHTLFVPTNEAFGDMSIEEFAELTNPNNRSKLVRFVNSHFYNKKIESTTLKEYDIIDLKDNMKIKLYSDGNTLSVGGASVAKSDIKTANGIIHVLDGTINTAK